MASIESIINRALNIKKTINFYFKNCEIDFNEIEACFDVLSSKINVIKWLVSLAIFSFRPYSDEWDSLDGFFEGIRNANLCHLNNLIKEIDNECGFSETEGFQDIFNNLVESNNITGVIGIYFMFNSSLINKPIKSENIIYPANFVFWNKDDLIESIYAFITGDTIYDIDNWLKNIPTQDINPDIIEIMKTRLERYYFLRQQKRLRVYEEELNKITWEPSRVMDWCFEKDYIRKTWKNDFLI
jgi:hypothetical protein